MGFIDKNLLHDEEVVYRTTLHWIVFLPYAATSAVSIVSAVWLASSRDLLFRESASLILLLTPSLSFLLSSILAGLLAFISFKTSEFGVTSKRVLVKTGIIGRKSVEILLVKVEAIQVDQSILGRILGYGSVTIVGTGGTRDPFRNIRAPLEFRTCAQEQIAREQDASKRTPLNSLFREAHILEGAVNRENEYSDWPLLRSRNKREFSDDLIVRLDRISERISGNITPPSKCKSYNGSNSFIAGGKTLGKLIPDDTCRQQIWVGFSIVVQRAEEFARTLGEPEPRMFGPDREPFLMVSTDPAVQEDDIVKSMTAFLEAGRQG